MVWIAAVLTPYAGDGSELEPFRPEVAGSYPAISFTDITGAPGANLVPDVNLYVVEVRCAAAELDAIEADERYHVLTAYQEALDADE